MPPINIMIKPSSGNCNLRCEYCFYEDEQNNRKQKSYGFMSIATLENVIQKTLAYADGECTFVYQGGEPTLRGLDFFKKSIEYQKKYNKKGIQVHNAIQTNGYRLLDEWAKFFHENHFLVGLSIDGIKHTHNCFRRTPTNEDTFLEVMGAKRLFDQYNVDYNILTVVNARTVQYPSKIYQFYKKYQMKHLQFIPCLDPIGEAKESRDYSLKAEPYGNFLIEVFKCWYDDLKSGEQPYIRSFENYIGILLGYPPEACDQSGNCSIQHVVESDGEVYPCDFYVLDEYKLGNLNDTTFKQLHEKRKEIRFIENSFNISEKCKSCDYYVICRGGCNRHRNLRNGDGTAENCFCQAYQMFFEACMDRMKLIARTIMRQV